MVNILQTRWCGRSIFWNSEWQSDQWKAFCTRDSEFKFYQTRFYTKLEYLKNWVSTGQTYGTIWSEILANEQAVSLYVCSSSASTEYLLYGTYTLSLIYCAIHGALQIGETCWLIGKKNTCGLFAHKKWRYPRPVFKLNKYMYCCFVCSNSMVGLQAQRYYIIIYIFCMFDDAEQILL